MTVEVDGTIFALRGWQAHGLALGAGLRPTFSGVRGAWIADTSRLADLLAYLAYRNVDVEILDDCVPAAAQDAAEPSAEPEFDLFGGAS